VCGPEDFSGSLIVAEPFVDGNVVSGNCTSAAIVHISVAGDVVVESNQIRARLQGAQALFDRASSATVSANRLRGGSRTAELIVDPKRAAVIGNLSNSDIHLSGAPLGPPWDSLNPSGIL
jgi:hypothetical protein